MGQTPSEDRARHRQRARYVQHRPSHEKESRSFPRWPSAPSRQCQDEADRGGGFAEEKTRFGILRTLRGVRGDHTQAKCQDPPLVVPIEPTPLISLETRIPPWQSIGLFRVYFIRDSHLLPCELFCNLYRRTRAKIACFRALANAKPLTNVFFEA